MKANTLISLRDFELEVQLYFDYLISVFEFSYVEATSQPFSYHVRYRKKNRIVSVDMGYRHNFVEINIFDKVDKIIPTTQNFDHSVSLSALMYKKKANIGFNNEYENIMPSVIGLQESLSTLSKLFKIHASDILLFRKWTSFNDCK